MAKWLSGYFFLSFSLSLAFLFLSFQSYKNWVIYSFLSLPTNQPKTNQDHFQSDPLLIEIQQHCLVKIIPKATTIPGLIFHMLWRERESDWSFHNGWWWPQGAIVHHNLSLLYPLNGCYAQIFHPYVALVALHVCTQGCEWNMNKFKSLFPYLWTSIPL